MDKTNTLFVERYEHKNTNDLLNEILKRAEIFNRMNGYIPDNVRLNVNQYYELIAYNPTLIKEEDKSYYILGMKIVF